MAEKLVLNLLNLFYFGLTTLALTVLAFGCWKFELSVSKVWALFFLLLYGAMTLISLMYLLVPNKCLATVKVHLPSYGKVQISGAISRRLRSLALLVPIPIFVMAYLNVNTYLQALEEYCQGNRYANSGQLTQALSCFDQALKIRPDFPAAYGHRANVKRRLGKLTSAADDYICLLKLDPDCLSRYVNLNTVYEHLILDKVNSSK